LTTNFLSHQRIVELENHSHENPPKFLQTFNFSFFLLPNSPTGDIFGCERIFVFQREMKLDKREEVFLILSMDSSHFAALKLNVETERGKRLCWWENEKIKRKMEKYEEIIQKLDENTKTL
jgi:hypothetical protein